MEFIWRGPQYETTRLLLLGESQYSWMGEDGQIEHPGAQHCSSLVEEIIEDFETSKVRFMKCLSKAITGQENPSKHQLVHAWNRVAFTNFVRGTVGHGPRTRPSEKQWEDACQGFPDILEFLKPKCVIVLGKALWDNMPRETDVYFSKQVNDAVQGYRLQNGQITMCWQVNHPSSSRGIAWHQLASIIHFSYVNELMTS